MYHSWCSNHDCVIYACGICAGNCKINTTTTIQQAFLPDNRDEPVPKRNINLCTPRLCGYYSLALISFLHLSWSTASSTFSYQLSPSCSQPLSRFPLVYLHVLKLPLRNPCIFTGHSHFFIEHGPYYLSLFRCTTVNIFSVPCLSQLTACEFTPHIHPIFLLSVLCKVMGWITGNTLKVDNSVQFLRFSYKTFWDPDLACG